MTELTWKRDLISDARGNVVLDDRGRFSLIIISVIVVIFLCFAFGERRSDDEADADSEVDECSEAVADGAEAVADGAFFFKDGKNENRLRFGFLASVVFPCGG